MGNGNSAAPSRSDINNTPVASHGHTTAKESDKGHIVNIDWKHGGHSVYITGSFNRWRERIPMKHKDGVWSVGIRLPIGLHQYKYVVDNEWKYDHTKPTRSDPIGNVNNIIEIHETLDDPDAREYTQTLPVLGQGLFDNMGLVPDAQPKQLNTTPLNRQMKDDGRIHPDAASQQSAEVVGSRDPCLLPLPEHVVLTHLYRANTATTTQYGVTVRFRNKFVTTIVYNPSSGVLDERRRIEQECQYGGTMLRPGESLGQFYLREMQAEV
ncbi:hypothetical protein J8273_0779 [Carpediemonas membranifera]|uniref:Association with the SNF1 complex (ASC) domain-containing protein n=1 Tax=Carpediemonas membranifera TaxID=201153 RepID=A0A8J6BC09_9EUKA|nr:hypothetical protein J8273_0779 [Carpediemonas membranifera]|eukprot:KAG9397649.1 hypothetical protein J8273_0779 [Carpediemonas membranifera]